MINLVKILNNGSIKFNCTAASSMCIVYMDINNIGYCLISLTVFQRKYNYMYTS